FFQLEVGDAVAQQAADAAAFLKYGHAVSGARQLLRAGQSGGAGADDGDFLAGAALGWLGTHPAFLPAALDDGVLDGLDADGVVVDVQRTGRFAGGGADPSGELREVVGGVQCIQRRAPLLAVDQVVPVGDQIVDGAAVVAERDAAVHAAGGLVA